MKILSLLICLLLPALGVFALGETKLTNSGDLTPLTLTSWAQRLTALTGVRIDVNVTNTSTNTLRIPATWRAGRTLGRTLMDCVRVWPALRLENKGTYFSILDNPTGGLPLGNMDLIQHVFSLAALSDRAGGIVNHGAETLTSLPAPSSLPIKEGDALHLANLGRFYGFLDFTIGDEALTVRLFDKKNVFTDEIDEPDGSLISSKAWRAGVWYLSLGLTSDLTLYLNSLGAGAYTGLDASPHIFLEFGWHITDSIFLHANIKNVSLEEPMTGSSGGLTHLTIGAQYALQIGFLRLSAGIGLMLDEVSADTLDVYIKEDSSPVDGAVIPVASVRLWADLFGPFFLFFDYSISPFDYQILAFSLGFRL